MRTLVKDIISEEEAEQLLHVTGLMWQDRSIKLSENTPPLVQKVLDKLSDIVDFKLHEESYWRIQNTPPSGIWWHKDTGSAGHMSWCTYGVSLLLTDEHGGRMKYRNAGIEEVVHGRSKLDMYVHSSDEEHMIEAPDPGKTRTVLLLFI